MKLIKSCKLFIATLPLLAVFVSTPSQAAEQAIPAPAAAEVSTSQTVVILEDTIVTPRDHGGHQGRQR